MRYNRTDFLKAFGAQASPLVLAAASKAAANLAPALSALEAGAVILAAVCPETKFGPLGPKALIGCDLSYNGRSVFLTPDDCSTHPGLSAWTRPTLAGAFMVPVEVGYTMAHSTGAVPVFDLATVVLAEGLCSGQLSIRFASGAHALLYYGQRPASSHFVAVAHSVSGDALYAIGEALIDAEAESAMPAPGESINPALGVLH